jgi:hypothetical protein
MDSEEFYLVSDNDYLITLFQEELSFVSNNWFSSGRPTMVVKLTNRMLGALKSSRYHRNSSKRNLFNFMMSLRSGVCNGVRIRLGRLSEMINTACIESLDFLISSHESNWHHVLSGSDLKEAEEVHRLSYHEKDLPTDGKPIPRARSSFRRRSISDSTTGSKSPLSKPLMDISNDDMSDFKLRDTLALSPENDPSEFGSPLSPTFSMEPDRDRPTTHLELVLDTNLVPNSPILTLSLGDPAAVTDAIDLLKKSSNLYDQIDLLHYLHSCHGLAFHVPGLATISALMEEVYIKVNLIL